MSFRSPCVSILIVLAVGAANATSANDWPTYNHDNARSAITSQQLELPLVDAWRYRAAHAPAPAWPAPAENDYWHGHRKLRPIVTYDRAFQVVVAEGMLYFGSSADDQVYALDARSGELRWTFFAEGPIRLAPVLSSGKLYFGSDDGTLYCLDAADGKLLWRFETYNEPQCVPGNGRMISRWPVRAGLVVDDGTVYFGAGLFPKEGTYLFAVAAESGHLDWKQTLGISPQGYMLASSRRLYIPTGRTTPTVFARDSGAYVGQYRGGGGAYALLTKDTLITGPGRGDKQITVDDTNSQESLAAFDGIRMVVDGQMAYMLSEDELSAFDHERYMELARQKNKLAGQETKLTDDLKKTPKGSAAAVKKASQLVALKARITKLSESQQQCYRWKVKSDCPFSLLLVGDTLLAGGKDKVVAFHAKDGKTLCTLPVTGKAYGLCVAEDRLYASTDQGVIHAFEHQPSLAREENDQTQLKPVKTLAGQTKNAEQRVVSCRRVVKKLLGKTDIRQGYCLLLGCEDGRLACELARQTNLRIICIESDLQRVNSARRLLDRAGLYGVRVSVRQGTLDPLPYPDYFANLIISNKTLWDAVLPPSNSEIFRVLRPCGGMAFVGQMDRNVASSKRLTKTALSAWVRANRRTGWTIHEDDGLWAELERGPLPGSGQWTHLYSDAANSACSGDMARGPMRIQWFGEPGPRQMVDRHHRPMSPLYKNGRLFISGDNRVITVDAYNGTHLWRREVPNSRRIGVMKDCGQMVVTDRYLFIASGDQCWGLDVASGARQLTLSVPQSPGTSTAGELKSRESKDWGFLDCTDDSIIGSAQKKGASFSAMAFRGARGNGSDVLEGDFRQVIISNALFSLDLPVSKAPVSKAPVSKTPVSKTPVSKTAVSKTAVSKTRLSKTRWRYDKGAIMNSTITVGDGRIFFAECRDPKIMSDSDGRIRIDQFCEKELFLVALDLETGQTLWEQPIELPYQHIMFASYADKTLVCTGTSNEGRRVFYDLFAFDAVHGKGKWQTRYRALDVRGTKPAETGGSHGEQWQHPVINGDTVYCRPFAFDLQTGKKKPYRWPRGGGGCGGVTGSAHCLFARGGNPRLYPLDVPYTEGIPLTQVTRPGCWINIIPAGGLVLIPESSSGCTCEYPIQTSIAFASADSNADSNAEE